MHWVRDKVPEVLAFRKETAWILMAQEGTMNPETIEALRKAYAALDRLPNWAKQSVQTGSVMAEIRHLLEREGVAL